ncbi:hypothetical protein GGX14DRAFT_562489 [Mycena pura]|uniref:Uncharacterized protein n=1 Tax=Mycena pura TaxID=153505 RepID=A0AAD6VPC1_9AGAR|nr:hypothetical protein GGX14DRAFT_562489 [Mycena pura]
MLDFIDELNIKKCDNLAWNYWHVDPTHITKAVGHIINDVGKLGAVISACGPRAKKVAYLRKANRELFAPKGLRARIVTAWELRERLEIALGKHEEIHMSQRQISALDGRVAETKLVPLEEVGEEGDMQFLQQQRGAGAADEDHEAEGS